MRKEAWGLAALLALALALRLAPAIRTDPQLDELYTFDLAAACGSFGDLFAARMRSDNNHPLTTLWIFLAGCREPWVCRLPSVLFGTAAVALAWALGRRSGDRREPWLAAGMVALSYPLVFSSSEARGYAGAAFFALLALLLRPDPARGRPRRRRLAAFWAACLLGLLAHFSFILVLAGFAIAETALLLRRDLRRPVAALRRLAIVYAPVLAPLALLHLLWVRKLKILGGPIYDTPAVAGWFLAEALNAPFRPGPAAALACAAAVAVFAAHGIWKQRRDDAAVLSLALLGCAPALVVLTARPQLVYSRYFLVLLPVLLLAIARSLAALLAAGGLRRVAALLFLAVFAGLGAQRSAALAAHGKSQFAATLDHARRSAAGRERVTLCSAKRGMAELVVRRLEGRLAAMPGAPRVVVAPGEDLWQREGACDYALLTRDTLEAYRLEAERAVALQVGGRDIRLEFARPSADRLETDWFLYRPATAGD